VSLIADIALLAHDLRSVPGNSLWKDDDQTSVYGGAVSYRVGLRNSCVNEFAVGRDGTKIVTKQWNVMNQRNV
jgi:hypothetical protein